MSSSVFRVREVDKQELLQGGGVIYRGNHYWWFLHGRKPFQRR